MQHHMNIVDSITSAPPASMPEPVPRFLETNPRSDITFEVEDRDFEAHFRVFRMRSPNFNVANFGPVQGDGVWLYLTIDGMRADAFEAAPRFVYTDATPAVVDELLGCCGAGPRRRLMEKVRDLLVAADRFGMERLVRMCEEALYCEALYMEYVSALCEGGGFGC